MMNDSATGVLQPVSTSAALSSWRSPFKGATGLIALVMIVLLAGMVLPPIWVLIQNSLSVMNSDASLGGYTTAHFAKLFADPNLLKSAINSTVFAALSTLTALAIGGTLAWLVERTNVPLRGLAMLTTIISLGLPNILYVLAWLYLLGRAGPVNDVYRLLTGNTDIIFSVHSMAGMVMIEAFSWLPLVFLMFGATFRAANAEMEEAARMSGASLIVMMRRISLQLARPAILAAALFVFVRSLEDFDVPVLIGRPGNINVMTTDIFFSVNKVPPDIGHASAFSVVLTVVVGILMFFYGRIARNAERFASVTGKGFRPRPMDLGWARWLGGSLVIFHFLVVVALPLFALAWVSLLPFVRPIRPEGIAQFTLSNFRDVLHESSYLKLAANTLISSAIAATVVMILMMVVGWLVARRKPGAALLDQLTTLPLLLPGIVLGVSMMELALRSPLPLYGTLSIIVIAYSVRYLPFGMRYAFSGVLQIHKELEEAAHVAGANTFVMLRRVVTPLLMPALVAGWLFIFLNAARELSTAILLAGPDSQTMAVAIYLQSRDGQFSEIAALGLIWTLFMTTIAVVFHYLLRRQTADTFGK